MTSPRLRDRDSPVSAFLVERYLPPTAAGSLAASVARAARLCAASAESGSGVQYLQSAYLPSEDTCFCLFRAVTADAVRALNIEAEFALDRITDAVLLLLPTTQEQADASEPGGTRST
jgi:Protein of unknown function (DUF4242)